MVIAAAAGLHARPAILLSRLAKQFTASIRVRSGDEGEWVDAKSIVRLMTLRVARGGQLQFSIRGADAERAVREVGDLIARNFDEADGAGRV